MKKKIIKTLIVLYSFIIIWLCSDIILAFFHYPNFNACLIDEMLNKDLIWQLQFLFVRAGIMSVNIISLTALFFITISLSFLGISSWRIFNRTIFGSIIITIFLLIAVDSYAIGSGNYIQYETDTPKIFNAIDLDGKAFNLFPFYYSNETTILEFTGTTCGYCHDQTDVLAAIMMDKPSLKIFSITGPWGHDTLDSTNIYIQMKNISWNVIYDLNGEGFKIYEIRGYPSMIFITNGKIVAKFDGLMSYDDIISIVN